MVFLSEFLYHTGYVAPRPPLREPSIEETFWNSDFQYTFFGALHSTYSGKNRYEYDQTLPVGPFMFWNKYDLGILGDYVRLFPQNWREIQMLGVAEDPSQSQSKYLTLKGSRILKVIENFKKSIYNLRLCKIFEIDCS